MDTLYDLLGALPHDDAEGLRSAFRRAVKGAHPDLRPDDPDAALKFREIVRAHEILGDAEQRAAYDHLLGLACQEQGQDSRQAVFARVHRLASAVIAFAGISIATVGGYLLFMHMSVASVAPLDDIDTAARAPSEIAAASPVVAPETADKGVSPANAIVPGPAPAPSVAAPAAPAESVAPAAIIGPAPDAAATEARSLRARGMSAYRHGDLNGAIADLDQALQRDPTFLPAYIDRGTILYRMRKVGRAFADIAGTTRIEDADRAKSAAVPIPARKPRIDRAAVASSVTPLPQRRKAAQKPSKEEFAPPPWGR